ncbi:MAG: hypothetical protein GTO14_12395 [Anaerolineales bacterium]|nr:hypothetical protein [Anaerolineales bacterium]
MSTNDSRTETRQVSDFDRVALTGLGELIIQQGDVESLTIDAPPEILNRIKTEVIDGKLVIRVSRHWLDWIGDVLTAGFTGMRVRYNLTVKRLSGLRITGAARVKVGNIETDSLTLDLRGAGEVMIESLDAEQLDVDLPGAGKIRVAGRVTEQKITLSGAGSYTARKLESQKARVTLEGLGSATVWAVDELDVAIRGVGTVSYYGSPKVSKEIAGPGSINSLGNP